MMSAISRYMVLLLSAACLVQGYYIHARGALAAARAQEFQARHDKWVSDIENLKRSMTPLQQGEQDAPSGRSFEEWFQARVAVSGIRTAVNITDSQVIVSFKIPGLKAESLKIIVNEVLIRASYSARSVVEDSDGRGGYRSEAVRQFETVMPIPPNADAGRHKLVPDGDGFKIIFEKRDDPALKF